MNFVRNTRSIIFLAICGMSAFSQTPPSATVYFYQYRWSGVQVGGKVRLPVLCDGEKIASIQPNTSFAFPLTSGKHVFSSDDKRSVVELNAKPGEVYYVRVDPYTPGLIVHGSVTLVPPEQGKPELEKTQPLPAKYLRGAH